MKPFSVLVGNVGHVHEGNNLMRARSVYADYVKQSQSPYGRASGEPVTLFHNGQIKAEYFPPNLEDQS